MSDRNAFQPDSIAAHAAVARLLAIATTNSGQARRRFGIFGEEPDYRTRAKRGRMRRNGLVEFAARKRAGCMAGEGAKRQAFGCLGHL